LDLTGWVLDRADGISSGGKVLVGSGCHPSGEPDAWMVNLAAAFVAGDGDRDGSVDIFDVAVLQMKSGTTSGATWADGDFDGNGTVDNFDVAAMQVNYR
jgi:hypothetical protein